MDAADAAPEASFGDPSDLSALADKFLAGGTLDADALFAGTGRRRVPLPVYPFAETRYWVDEVPLAKPSIAAASPEQAPRAVPVVSASPIERAEVKLAPLDSAPPPVPAVQRRR